MFTSIVQFQSNTAQAPQCRTVVCARVNNSGVFIRGLPLPGGWADNFGPFSVTNFLYMFVGILCKWLPRLNPPPPLGQLPHRWANRFQVGMVFVASAFVASTKSSNAIFWNSRLQKRNKKQFCGCPRLSILDTAKLDWTWARRNRKFFSCMLLKREIVLKNLFVLKNKTREARVKKIHFLL